MCQALTFFYCNIYFAEEVCFEKKDAGHCKAAMTKWFFNTESNTCEEFTHSGCGGNLNAFDTKAECMSVCPSEYLCSFTLIASFSISITEL